MKDTEQHSGRPGRALDQLPARQRRAIAARCERLTLDQALAWISERHGITLTNDQLTAWLCEHRVSKLRDGRLRGARAVSVLEKLSASAQAAVFKHCEEATLTESAAWLKSAHNIDITPENLGRWLRKRREDLLIEERVALIEQDGARAMLLNEASASAAAALSRANSVMISQLVFEELCKPQEQRDEKRLTRYLALALRARCVDIADGRFAAQRTPRTPALRSTPSVDDEQYDEEEEEKVQKAMLLLFGPEPEGFTSDNEHPETHPQTDPEEHQ